MAKEFDVTIVETLKMKVTVEAESMEDAMQLVGDKWYNGDYVLDADNFVGVEFEPSERVVELSYQNLSEIFNYPGKSWNKAHIKDFQRNFLG